jgi:hypothetical protein
MIREVPVAEKCTLKEVQERFEDWRGKRRRVEPIPEELWAAAVRLTKELHAKIEQLTMERDFLSGKLGR